MFSILLLLTKSEKKKVVSQLKPCYASCLFACLSWEHLANHFSSGQLKSKYPYSDLALGEI